MDSHTYYTHHCWLINKNISSVWTLVVVQWTYQKQWPMGTARKREFKESACFDDDNGDEFHSPDGDPDFFDIVAGVLQKDTLAPCLFIFCLDYMLRTSIDLMKENGFTLEKARSR